jgi:hypothetical protein
VGKTRNWELDIKNRKKMRPNRDKSKETKQGENLHGLHSLNLKTYILLNKTVKLQRCKDLSKEKAISSKSRKISE